MQYPLSNKKPAACVNTNPPEILMLKLSKSKKNVFKNKATG